MSMNPVFNTNGEYLASKIFYPQRPRIGANTYLNVNVLPDFVEYIKKNLTSQELISLSEYQLQTYIMELSIKQKVTESFDKFVQRIISYMRERKQFWLNEKIIKNKENQEKQIEQKKHQHQAIRQYHADISIISKTIPQFEQKPFFNYKKKLIPQFVSTNDIQFMDRGKQILKVNVTNYAMMPGYVFKNYLEQNKESKKQFSYQKLSFEQKKILNTLQNTCQYFLMIQKPRSFKPQVVKRRQLARSRVLPSYLQNKDYLLYDFQNEIQASSYEKQQQNMQQNNQAQNQKNGKTDNNQLTQEEQDSQNEFYNNFHQILKRKSNYDSKMFSKQLTINQSHNILQVLKCLVYLLNKEQTTWFQKTWKQLQQQRIMREKKRKEQEDEQNDESQNQDQQQQAEKQKQNNQQNQQKDNNGSIKIMTQNNNFHHQDSNRQKTLQENNEKLQNKEISKQEKLKNIQIAQNKQLLSKEHQNNQQENSENKNIHSKKDIPYAQNQNSQNKLSSASQYQQKMDVQQQKHQSQQVIQIGVRKPIFDQIWKNPSYNWKKLSKYLSNKILSMREIYFITKQFIDKDLLKQLQFQRQFHNKPQDKSKNLQNSLISPQISLDDIYLQFKEMIQHPQHVKLSSFKTQGITIPWDNSDYLLFLKGLLQFFFVPTNNRKIAQYMMSKNPKKTIQANHVKFVKGNYLKNMHIRIDRGQSGGGKKGRMLGKTQFLQKDIQFFSMRWFDKIKKSKKKKLRRRMFQQEDDAADEVDSAY